jgi:putative DNA methylase
VREQLKEIWGDFFTPRQLLSLTTFVSLARKAAQRASADGMSAAVQTILGLAISRWSDICNSLCVWENTKTQVRHAFTRQAVPMIWDFAEPQIFADAAGNYSVTLETMLEFIQRQAVISTVGVTQQASAAEHPLPADCADAFVTDPGCGLDMM